jgi:hypothetical protein
MAQKTKVKELVGRSLNSYHTKALQQIERIEKKNKEQNHKINILTGELDKDYITKTAEGSVISLDHSKEGMVYLDELQGNTLVNYCTDGSKEMTLNGDIDVEGTFVTTTEGVDNGKVDVLCEGNTLVNLYKSSIPKFSRSDTVNNNTNTYNITTNNNYIKVVGENLQTSNYRYIYFDIAKLAMLKPNTKYTIIFKKCKVPSLTKCTIQRGDSLSNISNNVPLPNGSDRLVLTTKDTVTVDSQGLYIWNFVNDTSLDIEIELAGIIEGDYTNKEIPSKYFEGMKSVGQDDENTHKIEILSKNKNLLNPIKHTKYPCFIKKGTKLVLSEKNNTPSLGGNVKLIDINENVQWFAIDAGTTTQRTITTNNDIYYIENALGGNLEYQVEIGTTRTPYVPYAMNKKEISINEPLRGLSSDKRDKLVKIGGKWFVERNFKELIIDGVNFVSPFIATTGYEKTVRIGVDIQSIKAKPAGNGACVAYPYIRDSNADTEHTRLDGTVPYGNLVIWVNRSKLKSLDVVGANDYFKNNPVTVMVELATPTYKPLEIEPTLNTYTDITYISNDSLIPCNMKIQNTGYNAIIKPNTLYTVALDTNKGGTIGVNLGGAKGTTTNNVLKLTTPATLTDDSLRLYGKGIKGSKVRLLEGDKTNWMPSFFEGMKSSFEDKVQDDGSYKMEILMNNENLLDSDNLIMNNHPDYTIEKIKDGFKIKTTMNGKWLIAGEFKIKVKPNTNYTLGYTKTMIKDAYEGNKTNWDVGYTWIKTESDRTITEYKAHNNTRTTRTFNSGNNTTIRIRFNATTDTPTTTGEYDFTDISLVEDTVNSTHIPQKTNKIQFSSIEPLRAMQDYKDRFVFKDEKLMIERNTKECTLDETQGWGYQNTQDYGGTLLFSASEQTEVRPNMHLTCNMFNSSGSNLMTDNVSWRDREGIGCWSARKNFNIRIKTCRLSSPTLEGFKEWIRNNEVRVVYPLSEPIYEEIPFELQKIILEGYENGTLFFDTNIPPTSVVTYAGETPIVKATRLNKTEVSNNTVDINDNILPYLMDMDYRVVMLQLATEENEGEVSMARLFGGTYEMLKRDILSKRLSRQEYGYRLADYFNAGKLTEEQVRELEDLR